MTLNLSLISWSSIGLVLYPIFLHNFVPSLNVCFHSGVLHLLAQRLDRTLQMTFRALHVSNVNLTFDF